MVGPDQHTALLFYSHLILCTEVYCIGISGAMTTDEMEKRGSRPEMARKMGRLARQQENKTMIIYPSIAHSSVKRDGGRGRSGTCEEGRANAFSYLFSTLAENEAKNQVSRRDVGKGIVEMTKQEVSKEKEGRRSGGGARSGKFWVGKERQRRRLWNINGRMSSGGKGEEDWN